MKSSINVAVPNLESKDNVNRGIPCLHVIALCIRNLDKIIELKFEMNCYELLK